MSGNSYQYDPTEMFKTWIQKSGRAQAEFILVQRFRVRVVGRVRLRSEALPTLHRSSAEKGRSNRSFWIGLSHDGSMAVLQGGV